MKAAKTPKSNQNNVTTKIGLGRVLPRLILVELVSLGVFVAFIVYLPNDSVFTELGNGVDTS